MRKLFLLAAILTAANVPTQAQTNSPNIEVFGGYAYLNARFIDRDNLNGFGASFAGNFGDKWGFVGEVSGHYGSARILPSIFFPEGKIDFTKYYYLFGPRFSKRTDRATVFGHVLLGGAHERVEGTDAGSGFALAVGGGLDINAGKSWAVRVFQLDYIPDHAHGVWEHNFRAQVGIVFKF